MTKTKYSGAIAILHNGFEKINLEECTRVIKKEYGDIPVIIKTMDYKEIINYEQISNLNQESLAVEHREFFKESITPLVQENPNYIICYFGLAPIPLIVDFGSLFHDFQNIVAFQKHHINNNWEFSNFKQSSPKIEILGVPAKTQIGLKADVVLRISTSFKVNESNTREIISDVLEIDILNSSFERDTINSLDELLQVSNIIRETLYAISENESRIRRIHLFAAIPCGVAFLLGVNISPSMHPEIVVYQYCRSCQQPYIKGLVINARSETTRDLTSNEETLALEKRTLMADLLKNGVKPYLINKQNDNNDSLSWVESCHPSLKKSIMSSRSWKPIPKLFRTSLIKDTLDFDKNDIGGEFFWLKNMWFLDDRFFVAVSNRLKDEEDLLSGFRLFLFHEALHYNYHNINYEKSQNIGSFPKILEMTDYQADVYALINEYDYRKTQSQITDVRELFLKLIEIATETMWSFDDNGSELVEIQIRRLNRYLIWYINYIRIESYGESLDDVIAILEDKPNIELNGLVTFARNNRFYFELEQNKNTPLEIGIIHENKIYRKGHASNLDLNELIRGIKKMDKDKIISPLRSLIDA